MYQNHLNYRVNFNDIYINDSFAQETNSQNQDYNLFSYWNMKSLNQNDIKIEDESLLNNYFIQKNILKDKENIKDNQIEKRKITTNKEKTLSLKKNYSHFLFSTNRADNNEKILGKTEIEKLKKNLNNKTHLGRKRKNECSIGEHNKFSGDNLRRKAKNLIIDYALDFLNEKINNIYKGNIGEGITIKKLLPINRFSKGDTTIQHNKDILNKTLGEIFSISISARYSYYSSNHNIELIKRLLNEKDENKRLFFKKLFNITFSECLKGFRGNETCEELNDFKKFSEIKKTLKDEPEYINELESYLKKYENNIKSKKGRKKRKKIEPNEKINDSTLE